MAKNTSKKQQRYRMASPPAPKDTATLTKGHFPKVLTNCTDSPRGISLIKSKKVLFLEAREIRPLSDAEYDEVRDMFSTETFQRFADTGIFRLSGIKDDEQSTKVKTPEPPKSLSSIVAVQDLTQPVSTYTGSRAISPQVVGHQFGGPLIET